MRHAASVLAIVGTIATIAISTSIAQSQSTGSAIDTQAIIDNEKSTSEWLSYGLDYSCLLYTSPSPRDATLSRMPSSA